MTESPLILGEVARLEDLVDRAALGEVCRSFHALFGLPIRVFSSSGTLLADAHQERVVCKYVNSMPSGQRACAATVSAVRESTTQKDVVVHPCFTGANYRIMPIVYDSRPLGRFVVGPYLPAETREVPRSLLVIDEQIDPERARDALAEMPRVSAETAERLNQHLARVLDLILFAGHRAFLTSEMHLASVRESYRELAEKAQRLEHAYERLQELDRLKSNFLATVSHELRTPLTSIIGYSEMLATGVAGPLSAEQGEFVETIRVKGDQLLALITSLLDLSKLEQGQVAVQMDDVDVRALLDEIATTVLPTAGKKNVHIEVATHDGVRSAKLDPIRLRQVLINLTDNAIKFTPSGGTVKLEAAVRTHDTGAESHSLFATPTRALELRVTDTGIGIPIAEQPKIFDAFYQVDGSSTRVHGGAGLGLSIVKRLVDAHHGTIFVESTPGKGASFIVVLPNALEGH